MIVYSSTPEKKRLLQVDDDLAKITREAGRNVVRHVNWRAGILAKVQGYLCRESERRRLFNAALGDLGFIHAHSGSTRFALFNYRDSIL
jgi:hypothetical protein